MSCYDLKEPVRVKPLDLACHVRKEVHSVCVTQQDDMILHYHVKSLQHRTCYNVLFCTLWYQFVHRNCKDCPSNLIDFQWNIWNLRCVTTLKIYPITRWGPVMHRCTKRIGHHWSRKWFVICSMTSHYLKQCYQLSIGQHFQLNPVKQNHWNLHYYTMMQENTPVAPFTNMV